MKDFIYHKPTTMVFGRDAAAQTAEMLAAGGCKKALLIYGGNSLKTTGTYDKIVGPLHAAGIETVECGGITAPEYKFLEPCFDKAKAENVDAVIGIGGSTCMDFAKMTAFALKHDDIMDYLTYEKAPQDGDAATIVCIPTYPAGGSEVDDASEVDYMPNGRHGGIYGVHPDYAILNPEFSFSLSKELTAYGAFVVINQASVNYLGGEAITDKINKALIEGILENLPIAQANPEDYDARGALMFASTQGTGGVIVCGKDHSWPMELYDEVGIIRKLCNMKYREVFTGFFPRWAVAHGKHHPEDIKRYFVDIWGIDPALEARDAIALGAQKMVDTMESFGIPGYYDAYAAKPTDEEIRAAIIKEGNAQGDLSIDEQIEMFKNCFKG